MSELSDREKTSLSDNSGPNDKTRDDDHPRKGIPEWKWKLALVALYMTSMVNGYDVSNVANLQPRIYEAFGYIEVLPWIGLSYSLANFAALTFARKVIRAGEMRLVHLTSMVVFMVGAAVAGSAKNMASVIIGRVIMGVGGSVVQQSNMSYCAVFGTAAETPGMFSIMAVSLAIGIVIGAPIGSAFSTNSHATWRWALYLNLPWVGVALLIHAFCLPSHSFSKGTPLRQRIARMDPIGIIFNLAAPALFAIALTLSGPVWDWGSGASIAVWVVFAIVFVAWGLQQYFCIFTTPQDRSFPLHMIGRRDMLPIWIAAAGAGAPYAITLYYMPLFFAFARGFGAMQQTVHILPFIIVFIVSILASGAALPAIGRYNILYILGGVFTLAGGAAMASVLSRGTDSVTNAQVMGLQALIGFGLGMHFQHGAGLCNVINKDNQERVDALTIYNLMQMGGIAIALAMAGAVFQNRGYADLSHVLKGQGYSEHDIREALAGVSSRLWTTQSPAVVQQCIEKISKIIGREFYIVVSSAALVVICGLLMKREKLDFGNGKANKETKDAAKADV